MKRDVRQPTPNQTIASGTQAMPEIALAKTPTGSSAFPRRRRRNVDRRQPAVDGVHLPERAQHEERDRAEQDSSEPPAPESRHRWTSPQRWMVSDSIGRST